MSHIHVKCLLFHPLSIHLFLSKFLCVYEKLLFGTGSLLSALEAIQFHRGGKVSDYLLNTFQAKMHLLFVGVLQLNNFYK